MNRLTTLGGVCEFRYGKSLPAQLRQPGIATVYGSNGPVGTHVESLLDGPAIIVGRKGSYGEVHYADGPLWPIDTTYFVDQTATDCYLRWLFHLLKFLPLNTLNKSAAIPGLNREDAYRQPIKVPPLSEQRRIAAILDKAETLRRKRQRAIDLLDCLTQSIFVDHFAGEENRKVPIGELCTISSGSTPKRDDPDNYGGNIPWIKTGEVNGGIVERSDETVTEKGARSARLKRYPIGTILIAMYGQGATRGRAAILGIEATINQACAAINVGPEIRADFLFHQLRGAYGRLRDLGRGGNQPNLNGELIRGFEVIVPTIVEQDRYVAAVRGIASQIEQTRGHAADVSALFVSLQHRAFAGEL
ncbi:restriction endonuclease subunit S [Mesorhizobium sp. CAU 1741]|uniref:restriction endonuclease subunit S n=1 Tax=Mesorhizobium sp. CAU 1741 TaxID=3140366 RepID=UPI00325AEDB2